MADKTAPSCQLKLEWVYGYRGHQCRNNLFYTSGKEIVYFVAGVGVVYNIHDNRQRFFLGHDDDIVSLGIHPDKTLVATGQIGKDPYICVWDTRSMQTVSILKQGHTHGITAIDFDALGNKLVTVGMDEHATINIWDWRKGKVLATVRGHTDKILDCQFDRFQENVIVSCGVKHIKFWNLSGNTLTPKKGIFGKAGEIQTITCLAFAPDSITYSGTLSGEIYVWNGNNLQDVIPAHKGPVFTMYKAEEGYVTGGKDGVARLWDMDFSSITNIDITSTGVGYKGLSLRSVCWAGEKILVGTQGSEIIEVSPRNRNNPAAYIQGHAEGELWALAIHPSKQIFATGSDDSSLRVWSVTDKALLSKLNIGSNVRSCSFDADGTHIAAGLNNGSFVVLKVKEMAEIVKIHDRKEVLHEMKYSPDGQFLAVGSNDNFVDVYAVSQRYKRVGTCSGNSSFITHLDWSEDSKYIQTNSGAAERLVFKAAGGKQVTGREELRNIRWHSWTGVLGNEVNGIWEKYTDTNDVNAADANYRDECVVTGDDFGLVKVFRFPCLKKGAKFRKYVGHSAHVTNIRFTQDKSRVISIGGADHAIFQWRFFSSSQASGLDDHNAYIDSNSEGSDSDLSDVAELDSDVEAEKQVSYSRDLDAKDIKLLKKEIKSELGAGEKRKQAPTDSLKLQFVHGYRGYDCRNNLFYTQTGDIVYHVAAVGIVYNKKTHSQRFYLQHTDDILSLAAHPLKDYVATGQVGKDPDVHIWDVETMKTISMLKGAHSRGVCALDFSADGKKLASIGLDDNHCIQVWDWRKGEKLAFARGHNDKIFVIKWNPHESNQAITVGVKHIKFWTQTGGGFTSQRGTFGTVAKLDTMMSVAFGKDPAYSYSCGTTGSIYIWKGKTLERVVQAHQGPCFAIHSLDKGFVTGGKDGIVCLYDENFDRCLKTFPIKRSSLTSESRGTLVSESPAVRSAVLGHGHILIGTKNGEILELEKSGPIVLLVQGHEQGEVWGLACHPTKPIACTVSDDKSLRIWDLSKQHRMMDCKVMKKPGRCCCFSPDGKAIAVGLNDGSFHVIDANTLEDIVAFHHRKEEISDIRFSPDAGKYLAVASHDNFVDIYNVMTSKRVGVCKGASSYITHVDWDRQGKLLMVNSGAREQLFFEAPRGHRQALRNAKIEEMGWDSWTCVLGHTLSGVWPPKCDVTDVNSAAVTKDRSLVATADDFGMVKLFNYPASGKFAKYKKYMGHSAHVTNVRWSYDDSTLVTVGGADTAVMVWSHVLSEDRVIRQGESDESGTESDEDGYDSDVQREKSVDYSSKTYCNPIRETEGVKPHLQPCKEEAERSAISRAGETTTKVSRSDNVKKRKEVAELTLHHIHGYRGFDGRNNVHFINDGADIVYHAAGAGIVLNVNSGSQSFYLEHTDDILCLTVNQYPKFKNTVASGQIGAQPTIKVWDAVTKKTVSVLQGAHKKAVCCVDFSSSGKLLLSVGLDDENSLAVWRWQEGALVGTAPGSSDRIFQAQFRPDSDSQFVTVGVNHVKFWSVAGNQLISKKAVLPKTLDASGNPIKIQTMLSLAFSADGITYTGAMSGDVYVWKDNTFLRMISKAHDGPIFTMYTTLKDGLIVTGAKEKRALKEGGCVKLWDQEMKRCRAYQIDTGSDVDIIKSVCRVKGSLLVGTKASEIILINEKSGQGQSLVQGHCEGELWGLAVHGTLGRFATASDDGTVRVWDIQNKALLSRLPIGAARSVSFDSSGELLAVGLKSGEFIVISFPSMKIWAKKRDRNSSINDIRFSPDGKVLAVGCAESCVDLYDATSNTLNKLASCKGIPSFVIQMDFSADSKHLRVSTGAYVHQVFSVPSGEPVNDQTAVSKVVWASWTSVLGDDVVGIWPKNADKADVNCAHLSNTSSALATGDDNGLVKLFQFPATEKYAPFKKYGGHSAHVTNVRFSHDDKYLISTGGDDCCVFVWKTQ